MIALNLPEVKDLMGKLLLQDTFDSFSFIEGSITTFSTFTINGYLKKDFYNSDEKELQSLENRTHVTWGEIRDYCYHIIKGKNSPLNFRFVLAFSAQNTITLLQRELPHMSIDQIQGLYLNFQFDKGKLECITGTSMKTFSMDKSLEHTWDDIAMKYFKQKQIFFEKL